MFRDPHQIPRHPLTSFVDKTFGILKRDQGSAWDGLKIDVRREGHGWSSTVFYERLYRVASVDKDLLERWLIMLPAGAQPDQREEQKMEMYIKSLKAEYMRRSRNFKEQIIKRFNHISQSTGFTNAPTDEEALAAAHEEALSYEEAPAQDEVDVGNLRLLDSSGDISRLSPCRPSRAPYILDPIDEEVEAHIQECRKHDPRPPELWDSNGSESFLRVCGLYPGRKHVIASTILEVISITIEPRSETSLVYGNISLIDEKDNRVHLYNRSVNDPEIVGERGCLTLSVSVVAAQPYKALVSLWDKDRNEKIAEGDITWYYMNQRNFDENPKVKKVYGDNGYVSITYRTLSAAAVAEVSVSVEKQNSYDSLNIYGAIRTIRNPVLEDKKNVVTLFRKEKNEAVCMRNGRLIKLSRSMVAVRGCSSLKIGVILYDIDTECEVVRGSVDFNVCSEYVDRLVIWGEDKKWKVVVEVDWSYHQKLLYEMQKTTEVVNTHHLPVPIRSTSYSTRSFREVDFGLVEVFSVSIGCMGCISGNAKDIYGKIRVRDCNGEFLIFVGNGKDTSIFWPYRCAKAAEFRMRLNLEDSEGNEICKGYLNLESPPLDFERVENRLCSVISGEKVCATIHYSVFTKAIQCKIVIEFFSAKSKLMNVFGKIVARYDKHEYKNYYDKKYYQSVLFESSSENPATVHSSGSYLPLVKRAVVVPSGCSVIISADLAAFSRTPIRKHSCGKAKTETEKASSIFVLKDEVKFKKGEKDSKIIDGDGFYLIVSLKWEK